MAAFSLATGLRVSNVTALQWPQVDLVERLARVPADQAKARKAIPVPLDAEAVGGDAQRASEWLPLHLCFWRR
jgi:integrase